MTLPGVTLEHLTRMSDHCGLFEHAEGTVARQEHGYCTDDNARLLLVTTREASSGSTQRLSLLALGFVLAAQSADGGTRNRRDHTGRWTDTAGTEDCWGRSLWALGAAAADHPDPTVRRRALASFELGSRHRSRWSRAMAFAGLGSADLLDRRPEHGPARAVLTDALAIIDGPITQAWPWPEPRLRYANASLAEAVIAGGAALGQGAQLERGLAMLRWLLTMQTRDGHLSVVGVEGRGPGDDGPQFDQQPIEVAAIADACWRAFTITGDSFWSDGISQAAAWFCGDNDGGVVMYDPASGGGYDGLHPHAVNLNQGAESTLAFISTMQRARSLAPSS